MKETISLALCVLLLLLPWTTALASYNDYSGPLDPETYEPSYTSDEQSSTGRVALSGSMYYDWTSRDYVYPTGDGQGDIHASVADGMVVTSPARVYTSGNVDLTAYLNGQVYTGNLSSMGATGEYVLSAAVNGQEQRVMGFTVTGDISNTVHTFVVPDGFVILDATRDGENAYEDRYSLSMEAEGLYVIEYQCQATSEIYRYTTQIDRTPPALTFSGRADREGRLRSQLDYSGLETGDTVYLTRSGVAVAPVLNGDGTGVIYDPGNYVMTVTDVAGNQVEYNFIILQYFNLQSWAFFLMVLAALVAVVVYVVIRRKRLKIG